MAGYPSNWISMALGALKSPVNGSTIAVMRAWSKSTPLPVIANNPIGMPKGSSGAPAYMGTGYAIFPSMTAFYVALTAFSRTRKGMELANALSQEVPAPATWRLASGMGWPGSATETDYPSAVLDLTALSYQQSINASPASTRKTSGMVGPRPTPAPTILNQARSLHQVANTVNSASERVAELLRRHGNDGG